MNIYDISSNDSIGNSLSSVNLNYLELEKGTLYLIASSQNYWSPMKDYYLSFQKFLKDSTTIVQNYSANWINTTTIVQNYSATWIKPITIFYPSVIYKDTKIEDILNSLLKWVTVYFPPYFKKTDNVALSAFCKSCDIETYQCPPINPSQYDYGYVLANPNAKVTKVFLDRDGDKIDDRYQCGPGQPYGVVSKYYSVNSAQKYTAPSLDDSVFVDLPNGINLPLNLSGVDLNQKPNYVENQTLIVYLHTWEYGTSIKENRTITDRTLCSTKDKKISVKCSQCYSGYVYCENGNFSCSGCSNWVEEKDLTCFYNSPPYGSSTNLTKPKNAYGSISAIIDMSFEDRNELDKIKGLVFRIVNCEWKFDKFLV